MITPYNSMRFIFLLLFMFGYASSAQAIRNVTPHQPMPNGVDDPTRLILPNDDTPPEEAYNLYRNLINNIRALLTTTDNIVGNIPSTIPDPERTNYTILTFFTRSDNPDDPFNQNRVRLVARGDDIYIIGWVLENFFFRLRDSAETDLNLVGFTTIELQTSDHYSELFGAFGLTSTPFERTTLGRAFFRLDIIIAGQTNDQRQRAAEAAAQENMGNLGVMLMEAVRFQPIRNFLATIFRTPLDNQGNPRRISLGELATFVNAWRALSLWYQREFPLNRPVAPFVEQGGAGMRTLTIRTTDEAERCLQVQKHCPNNNNSSSATLRAGSLFDPQTCPEIRQIAGIFVRTALISRLMNIVPQVRSREIFPSIFPEPAAILALKSAPPIDLEPEDCDRVTPSVAQ